jgi:hypothetical protein
MKRIKYCNKCTDYNSMLSACGLYVNDEGNRQYRVIPGASSYEVGFIILGKRPKGISIPEWCPWR